MEEARALEWGARRCPRGGAGPTSRPRGGTRKEGLGSVGTRARLWRDELSSRWSGWGMENEGRRSGLWEHRQDGDPVPSCSCFAHKPREGSLG